MVARTDPQAGEEVCEPVDAVVRFRVAQAHVTRDERFAVGNGVDDPFPQVGEVVLHRCEPSEARDGWST